MSVLTQERINYLEAMAQNFRADSLQLIHRRGAGHPGGALSAAEILAVLYFQELHIDPKKPQMTDRDRFILSKGHASAVLYAALTRRGFFDIRELDNWGEVDCPHQGHPDRIKTPGVDMTSGILGHGIAIGAGLALAARMNHSLSRTYVLIGDGESQAGIIWEGAATAAKYRLSNLVVILDLNDVQLDGPVHEIMPMDNMADRWKACGWYVSQVNGHNIRQLVEAFDLAREIHDKPVCIIARTTKGKGVSFMENDSNWHGNVPNADQLKQALAELGVREVTHG
jgi:transketolase